MILVPAGTFPPHPDFLELLDYFGPDFIPSWCDSMDAKGEEEANRFKSQLEFAQKSKVFCYQSIGLMAQGVHRPYIAQVLNACADRGALPVLDFGSGGGQLGLALHALGLQVSFADLWGESMKFLIWRLRRRNLDLPVYVLDAMPDVPEQAIITCFDVLEHMEEVEQFKWLTWMGEHARLVYVNLVVEKREVERGLHLPLDVEAIVAHVQKTWDCDVRGQYPDEDGEPRQHLMVYGPNVRKNL